MSGVQPQYYYCSVCKVHYTEKDGYRIRSDLPMNHTGECMDRGDRNRMNSNK
jgi:hypothetical protein